mmetsp:Transcript_23685/g.53169  ORF Transcript_23685/g.53169 Transcript_23685/m.53169 type:complete len:150 (-) Transcript_23685:152-601(-)|eukprot:763877-Hanusia_phi.AAC.3
MNPLAYSMLDCGCRSRETGSKSPLIKSACEKILYSRGNIEITESYIKLKAYYFPTATAKTIKFWDIKDVDVVNLKFWNTKAWGMAADCRVWWHFDGFCRAMSQKRRRGIVIHSGKSPFASGFTPCVDDFERVLELIKERIDIENKKLLH